MSAATVSHPLIIQGGMGVGVSNWVLAKAVSLRGQLGVVSGTCVDTLLVRRLQDGDVGGHMRRAMEAFPIPDVCNDVLRKYFRPEGLAPGEAYKEIPMYRQVVTKVREQLTVLASFVEVWLAKEGHDGVVGINLLTKVQMPNLATIYGAMLAGVDYVLMGAGIPKEIPGVLDRFAAHEPAQIKFDVEGMGSDTAYLSFDPRVHSEAPPVAIKRPFFLPIIASNSLATMLVRKASGRVDGFIIEAPTAGGHNAPPRGDFVLNERGEPQYGERDVVDLEKMKDHGLPFWLAGSSGSPEKLAEALDAGAAGIQVGTLFAYCEESGIEAAAQEGRDPPGAGRPHRRADGRPRVAHGLSVQGGADRRDDVGPGDVRQARAGVRPGLPARGVQAPRRPHRLPLRRRAGGHVRQEGRRGGEHGGPQVPVQRAVRHHRPARRCARAGWTRSSRSSPAATSSRTSAASSAATARATRPAR